VVLYFKIATSGSATLVAILFSIVYTKSTKVLRLALDSATNWEARQ
jgi:hypothetical protein